MQRMRFRRTGLVPAALVAVVVLTGCGADDPAEPEPTMSASPSGSGSPSGTPASPTVSAAIADLAGRTGASEEQITVASVEEVTWRDGSLGCAQPGYSYTQALVDGQRITLRVDGVDYEYHSGGRKAPFWCEKPTQ